MYKRYRAFLTILLFLSSSSCTDSVSTRPDRAALPSTLQALLQETIDNSSATTPGVSMSVIAPELDLRWQGAAGYDSQARENTLTTNQPFRIASLTKTFVAAAILRLSEQEKLQLDDPISMLISSPHDSLLQRGGYNPESISWRQILHHTSGLFDYALSKSDYTQLVMRNPKHRWTRTEQLALAMDIGSPTEPGTTYHYSDTGYILAGEAIEQASDTTLSTGLRQLLAFEILGLNTTWLESLEAAPKDHQPLVHCYYRKNDATLWDPSIDLYGGGGLVSTTGDLANFLHALFNHQVFQHKETLTAMLSPAELTDDYSKENDKDYKDYRLGLWHASVFGMDAFLHGGLWDCGFIHVPDLNLTIAVNCTDGNWERLVKKTILTIKNVQETSED